jgi:hypothetical protein
MGARAVESAEPGVMPGQLLAIVVSMTSCRIAAAGIGDAGN